MSLQRDSARNFGEAGEGLKGMGQMEMEGPFLRIAGHNEDRGCPECPLRGASLGKSSKELRKGWYPNRGRELPRCPHKKGNVKNTGLVWILGTGHCSSLFQLFKRKEIA